MKTLFHSLRWRLQAWHGLLLLLVVTAATLPAYHFALENQIQRIDQELRQMERDLLRVLMNLLQDRPPGDVKTDFLPPAEFVRRLAERPVRIPAEILERYQGDGPGHVYFSIRDEQGRVLAQSDNAPADMKFLPASETRFNEEMLSIGNRRESTRTTNHGTRFVIGREITPELSDMRRMAWLCFALGLGVWLLGLLGGWWLSGRAIRPIQTISRTASRIAEGNLRERIDPTAMDHELAQLSRVLNQTFERLHTAFERQRQFTADASNELRTPITILLSETQRLLKRDRAPEEYREALRTCGATAQRMRQLVEALLLLARQENHASAAARPCDLAVILREVIDSLRPLASERGRNLHEHLEPAPFQGDAESIARLASNLISNALQHGGNVQVHSGRRDQEVVLRVSDDGPGIPATALPHIFERFYRVDTARTSTSGHAGLGLAIAKAIATSHGGVIEVRSEPGQGACFEVRLPAAGG